MSKLTYFMILSALLVLSQACTKKDGGGNAPAASRLVGSCTTGASMACADYYSNEGADTLRPKVKEACQLGDQYGAGNFSESECSSPTERIGRCEMAKTDGPSGVSYSVVINYLASMRLTAAQVETGCTMIKGTFLAN